MEQARPILSQRVFSRTSAATNHGTRATLESLLKDLAPWLPQDTISAVEISVAEAMNNVVEHAYANRPGGQVGVVATIDDARLKVDIEDHGAPLPELTPPLARAHKLDGPRDSLPEGGFGWGLIRTLSSDLKYRRVGGVNVLTITFDFPPK